MNKIKQLENHVIESELDTRRRIMDIEKYTTSVIILGAIFFIAILILFVRQNGIDIKELKNELSQVPHKVCHNETDGFVCSITTATRTIHVIPSFYVENPNVTINKTIVNTDFKLNGEIAKVDCIPYSKEICEWK